MSRPARHANPARPLATGGPAATAHALAARQHGVVTRQQLLDAGLSRHQVAHLRGGGVLRTRYRGVYLVGPVASPRAPEMAAVLRFGPEAVISHDSAAALWRIPERVRRPEVVHLCVPTRRRHPSNIRLHHVRTLHRDEVTRLDGIPVTTPARTLLDLAAAAPARTIEQALAEALARRLTSLGKLLALTQRHHGRRGSARLRALLDKGNPARTRSEAEEVFLALIRRAKMTAPEVNVRVAGHEVDFLWRRERLVVEVDGYAFHSSRRAFRRDRRRDADLAAGGFRVIRVTWEELTDEPEAVIARVARVMGPLT